jgi:hypothetical protein
MAVPKRMVRRFLFASDENKRIPSYLRSHSGTYSGTTTHCRYDV